MDTQKKKKHPLILGILSIVLGLPFPIVGLILGIVIFPGSRERLFIAH